MECWLDQLVAGIDAVPYRELSCFSGLALEGIESVVNSSVHQGALFDSHEAASEAVDEAESARFSDCEARMIAIAEHLWAWQSSGNGNIAKVLVVGECSSHAFALQFELMLVVNVLPLASSTFTKVFTGRLDSVRRRADNLGYDGGNVLATPAAIADDPRFHLLSRDASEDIYDPAFEMCERVTEVAPSM